MRLHLGGGTHGQHPAVVQRDHPVGDAIDQRHVVLDHQDGDAELGFHVADPERHVVGLLHIQPGRRLIQQDQLRLGAQRAGQFDHLAHAIGQPGDELVPMGGKVKEIDDLLSSPYERDYVTVPLAKEVSPSFQTRQELRDHIAGLELGMREAAGNLEFERAAGLRDQVKTLRARDLGLADDG